LSELSFFMVFELFGAHFLRGMGAPFFMS